MTTGKSSRGSQALMDEERIFVEKAWIEIKRSDGQKWILSLVPQRGEGHLKGHVDLSISEESGDPLFARDLLSIEKSTGIGKARVALDLSGSLEMIIEPPDPGRAPW